MTILFLILIIIACALLGIIVLIQNPKGGGLSGTFGGFGNQVMGVKQTNDVLEKGTWIFFSAVAVLCIISTLFFSTVTKAPGADVLEKLNTNGSNTAPAPSATPPANTVPLTAPDTTKP
ncbi:MAG: preprotein translocase subunit SecG [Panacibacter sp.]